MLSKTATYWLAGIGVVGVAAVTPAILKYYHVWPGAADAPAPLVSPKATNTPAAASPPSVAAAPATAAAPSIPAATAEPTRGETPPAQQSATPDKAAPTAVASNNPVSSEQPSAPAPAATPAPAPLPAVASAPAAQPKPDPQRPAFDVVRVEPTGDAVIAGRASPRAAVQLRSDGRVVAQVDADESGQFAILPPPFSAGGHRLQLAARSGGASEVLSDAIGIEVPGAAEAAAPSPTPAPQPNVPPPVPAKPAAPASKPVETARSQAPAPKPAETVRGEAPAPPKAAPPAEAPKAKPPEPAKVATVDAAPASPAPAVVSILSVEASGTGRFEAKGSAEPNAVIRLYLNNAYLADAIVGPDGRWSLTIERGMTPGAYAIRADEIDRASGAVVARAEAPFNYPERPTAAQVAAATPTRTLAPTPEKAPAQPVQDQAASSPAAAPAPQPVTPQAAPEAKPSVATSATPAPLPTVAPQAAQSAAHEASQTSTPAPPMAAATAPEQPKADGTDVATKNSSAPAQSATPTETTASPPPATTSAPVAAGSPAVAAAEPAKPADSAHPVIPDLRTAKVVRGDNLWNLSKHFYGDGPDYKIIYEANASQIRNPRLIYPDQIFVVPRNPPQ